jgi:hypothetical protein
LDGITGLFGRPGQLEKKMRIKGRRTRSMGVGGCYIRHLMEADCGVPRCFSLVRLGGLTGWTGSRQFGAQALENRGPF